MARDLILQKEKKTEIKKFFKKLNEEMEFGVKKYTIAYCTAVTANKFFLKPKTIETYIYN